MAERLDPDEAPEVNHSDGSSATAQTQDGHLTRSDITEAPLIDGTDPLSDNAIDRRRGRTATPQLVIFCLFALIFAYFVIGDVMHGDWGMAVLGLVVLGICGAAIKREFDKNR